VGLVHLQGLTGLQALDLSVTAIGDALEDLDLSNTDVGDEGLVHLQALRSLVLVRVWLYRVSSSSQQ
jgi:hypothetical protein